MRSLRRQIAVYPNATGGVVSEEPGNQGHASHPALSAAPYASRHEVGLCTAAFSASSCRRLSCDHNEQQKAVVEAAFRPDLDIRTTRSQTEHH